jgi:hypothetical protein
VDEYAGFEPERAENSGGVFRFEHAKRAQDGRREAAVKSLYPPQ